MKKMQNIKLQINEEKTLIIPETLYGIFFEDINHSADGGLNAELIQNNSFEYEYINYNDKNEKVDLRYDKLRFWEISGDGEYSICGASPICKNNPTYLNVKPLKKIVLYNCGYPTSDTLEGIPQENGEYIFSCFLRNISFRGEIHIYLSINGIKSTTIAVISPNSNNFEKYSATLSSDVTCYSKLVIEFLGEGELDIDYISLINQNSYGDSAWTGGRLNGKIAKSLKELNPSFMRFPGGCIVEGDADKNNRYEWKETIGALQVRKQKANTWGYLQSYAIGFYEYFLLCDDFKMQPLPILPCGLLCQIRSGQRGEGDVQYTNDAVAFKQQVIDSYAHLLYFACGDVNSPDSIESHWAKIRADMGHCKPFNMKMIGVGNENWGDIYFENVAKVLDALSAYSYNGGILDLTQKFKITYVLSVGVDIRPQDTSKSWEVILQKYPNCIVDEHVYNSGDWFIDNVHRYDSYDRTAAKIFMGEYSMHTGSDGNGKLGGKSTVSAALAEAAFLTGVERNCDVVSMTAYAPLLACTKGYAWTPNLIWFNSRDVMRTPSYYVQSLFAKYKGDRLIDSPYIKHTLSGGLFIGGYDTTILLKNICVNVGDKVLYSHNFKNGLGDWQSYSNVSGVITKDGLKIDCNKLGGYCLNQTFSDCDVMLDAEVLGGKEGIILGVCNNIIDGKLNGMWLNCGAMGNKVAYEKYRNGLRVAFEVFENQTAMPLSLNKICVSLYNNLFRGFVNGTQVAQKNVYNTSEKIFYSVTADNNYHYIKVVNPFNDAVTLGLSELVKSKFSAKIITLSGNAQSENTIAQTEGVNEAIFPRESYIKLSPKDNLLHIEPHSLTIIIL